MMTITSAQQRHEMYQSAQRAARGGNVWGILYLVLVFFGMALMASADTKAATQTANVGVIQFTGGVDTYPITCTWDDEGQKLLAVIYKCIKGASRRTIDGTSYLWGVAYDAAYAGNRMFGNLTWYAITFALVMLGYKIVFAGVHLRGELGMFLFKILIAMFFINGTGFYEALDLIDCGSEVLSQELDNVFVTQLSSQNQVQLQEDGGVDEVCGPDSEMPQFEKMDKILFSMLGQFASGSMSASDKSAGKAQFMCAANLVAGSAFAGLAGFNVALLITGAFVSMITAFGVILMITAMSQLALSFLMLIGPLMVPFAFFQPTKNIFNQWLNTIFNYALQPVILMAFLSFAITLMDRVAIGNQRLCERIWDLHNEKERANHIVLFSTPVTDGAPDMPGDPDRSGRTKLADVFDDLVYAVEDSGTKAGGIHSARQRQPVPTPDGLLTFPPPADRLVKKIEGTTGGTLGAPLLPVDGVLQKEIMAMYVATIVIMMTVVSVIRQIPQLTGEILGNRLISQGLSQFADRLQAQGNKTADELASGKFGKKERGL